jgi:hypothetical protein
MVATPCQERIDTLDETQPTRMEHTHHDTINWKEWMDRMDNIRWLPHAMKMVAMGNDEWINIRSSSECIR